MAVRLSRVQRTERVHRDLLEAARAEFLESGYHGASLDRIAAAAGYTKGVVYSRYAGKADLFLALLEERITARAALNEELAADRRGNEGLTELIGRWADTERDDLAWTLLVIEFRVHAARDPALNARYAELHARTVAGLAGVLSTVLGDGTGPERARLLLATGLGATLERVVDPDALPEAELARFVTALAGGAGAS